LLIATLLYLGVCLLTTIIIKPYSVIHFIGPAAGVASAFTIIWGSGVLLSIVLGTIAFSVVLAMTTGSGLDFPVILISILAISLQSFWTKQITYRVIRQQRWLKSRAILFNFIFKIGPLAGLISASSVVVIAIVDMKTIGNSITYVFFSSWAASILTSVFFIPTLLFTQGSQQLSISKRSFVVLASTLGCIAIVLLFKVSQNAHQHLRGENFQKAKSNIELHIEEEIEMINEQVHALAALFQASEHVSFKEFTVFSSHIHRGSSSIRALEWIPLISHEHKTGFEQYASEEVGLPFFIKQQLATNQIIATEPELSYLPVFYIYPQNKNSKAFGLDLSSHPDKKIAMNLALKLNTLVASSPLTIVQDNYSNPGVLVFYPVLNNLTLNPHSFQQTDSLQKLNGYILAVVQFESFFRHTAETDIARNVSLVVQDVTLNEPFLLYGSHIEKHGRMSDSIELNVFTRKWQINITEKEPWINQDKDWQTWAMLFGGTIGGLTFQLLILMMAAYSVELSHQVVLKTKELLLAKESSETKSLAKSHFLQTLSGELKTPIYAIKYFVAKFHQHPTFAQAEHSIADIDNASHNLTQLIDTVIDLTEIESGAAKVIQSSVFDLHHFLQRVETLLNASNKENHLKFKFLINENVPHLIESDELRIQKLIVALAENAAKLLKVNDLNVSVKAHIHQFKRTTLFLVITPSQKLLDEGADKPTGETPFLTGKDLSSYSTTMAMVKELCQLFDGDVKLNRLPTGLVVLSASVKVNLSPAGHIFPQGKNK